MQAIGLIETKGLIASIEAADSMLKAADVRLIKKEKVTGGITTIIVEGDVGAVKAAVDAGAAEVCKLGENFLRSKHVIARPSDELELIVDKKTVKQENTEDFSKEKTIEEKEEIKEEVKEEKKLEEEKNNKLDNLLKEKGKEEAISEIKNLKVSEIRSLVKEIPDFKMESKKFSKLNKEQLIEEIEKYYTRGDLEDGKL